MLNALVVSLSTDMSVWEAWIERGAYLQGCIVRTFLHCHGVGWSMSVWEAWIERTRAHQFPVDVFQADTVARAN